MRKKREEKTGKTNGIGRIFLISTFTFIDKLNRNLNKKNKVSRYNHIYYLRNEFIFYVH